MTIAQAPQAILTARRIAASPSDHTRDLTQVLPPVAPCGALARRIAARASERARDLEALRLAITEASTHAQEMWGRVNAIAERVGSPLSGRREWRALLVARRAATAAELAVLDAELAFDDAAQAGGQP